MIHQILVIDPAGPCVIERTYSGVVVPDPQLVSGFLAAVYPRKKKLGYDTEKINKQLGFDNDKTFFEAVRKNRWIISGVADSSEISVAELVFLLHEVASLILRELGKPKGSNIIEVDNMEKVERKIDQLIIKKRSYLEEYTRNLKSKNTFANRLMRKFGG